MRGLDLVILVLYLLAVVALGCTFFRRGRTTRQFMVAGGAIRSWALGLSIFATFLSSNTFLGVPGKAFGSNWNSFVFSLSLIPAAWLAVRFFVPFHRRGGQISAYHHLETRFGPWARTYAVACYLLTQLARTGSILFGVALGLSVLTGWSIASIILATGALVTIYTLVGGIEAVIWTDVVQAIVLTGGALLVAVALLFGTPGGPMEVLAIAFENGKFSLGTFRPDFTVSSFWVVLLYGLFINLNNFGIDQSYVQRYHAAPSEGEARSSVWLAACLYLPVSLLFFFIGTALFSYYEVHPDLLEPLRQAVTQGSGSSLDDQVFPYFIVNGLPPGVGGLMIAAVVAAAMSSIDTSLNSSATVLLSDVYRRHLRPQASESQSMRFLYGSTLLMGALGTGTALAMIGVGSLLDAWWTLSGIFAGGLLGLFLLGIVVRRAQRPDAVLAAVVGVLVILWMTFADAMPASLRSPFDSNMITVVGTLVIFLAGAGMARWRNREGTKSEV